MPQVEKILETIKAYAKVYGRFEKLQEEMRDWLPVGDKKTGVIGEFYAMVYLRSVYPDAEVRFGNTSQHGWDIEVDTGLECFKVQVKTVSDHSRTRRLSPIHPGWGIGCFSCVWIRSWPRPGSGRSTTLSCRVKR